MRTRNGSGYVNAPQLRLTIRRPIQPPTSSSTTFFLSGGCGLRTRLIQFIVLLLLRRLREGRLLDGGGRRRGRGRSLRRRGVRGADGAAELQRSVVAPSATADERGVERDDAHDDRLGRR